MAYDKAAFHQEKFTSEQDGTASIGLLELVSWILGLELCNDLTTLSYKELVFFLPYSRKLD